MDDFKKKQKHAKHYNGCDCCFCDSYQGKDRALLNRIARRKLKRDLVNRIIYDGLTILPIDNPHRIDV